MHPYRHANRALVAAIGLVLLGVVGAGVALTAQSRREFDVVASKYMVRVSGSDSAEIRVNQNDLVHINFSTADIPHSFTVRDENGSHYRIMRRAEPGRPVSFDFRADTPGRFGFYCTLATDEKCREMHGTLVVEPAK